MLEFNLIPADYVAKQQKRRFLKLAMLGFVGGALLSALGYGFTAQHLNLQATTLAELREQRALSLRQQQRLSALQTEKQSLQRQALLLESLRSGASMPTFIQTLEQAIEHTQVWFVNWQFIRAGIVVEDDPQVRAPSYFVMVDTDTKLPEKWHNLTRMTIQGEARDHAALSNFVQRLFQHPTVDDVRVQRSAQGKHGITFRLAVVVKTERGLS